MLELSRKKINLDEEGVDHIDTEKSINININIDTDISQNVWNKLETLNIQKIKIIYYYISLWIKLKI